MKKILQLILILALYSETGFSQPKEKKEFPQCRYDYVQLTVGGGFLQPMGIMTDAYNPSGNIAFDLSYRINPEVAGFFETRYNFMTMIKEYMPTTGYLENTIGTRFYFISKNVRSLFFVEASIGTYTRFRSSYTDTNNVKYGSDTELKMGANGGVGGELVITDNIYVTLKAKYHTIFGVGGVITYITGSSGLTFRF